MNYLTEIKLFYDWLETHELTPSAILLWHGLMFIANRAGWVQPLTVPMNAIEARTMMTRSSIYRARKVLEESGILATSSRGSHRAPSTCSIRLRMAVCFGVRPNMKRTPEHKAEAFKHGC